MELESRRVIVTGAGQGIGRAIAVAMARSGARLYLWGLRKKNLLETQTIVSAVGSEVEVAVVDVSDASEVSKAWKVTVDKWEGVDVLVNNAGVQGPIGRMHEIDAEIWWNTIENNLRGTFLCSQIVLPTMVEQNWGKIINLSGGGAVTPRPFFTAYSASKAAIVRLTETLALEVKENNIDVNAIAPGAVNTKMLEQRLDAGLSIGQAEYEAAKELVKSGGTNPEKPAALAVFLASSKSDGLSGRLISAVWDSWESMDIAKLMATDTFTVRRLNLDEE
ncbi:MAG: dehydrogenase [Gemmatimonadetes bacterium]|jgi:NAD(P)-dependent dehydrogenase (short-subunit alcohol dehydrogenase family)|nr:dehydrogenase [Gemmatimonadota bacterium]